MLQVRVDPDRCDGYGRCEVIAPEVFRLGEHAPVEILIDGDIPEYLEGKVIRAVERCPKLALSLNVDLD